MNLNLPIDFLRQKGLSHIDAVVILGSGLGGFESLLQNKTSLEYHDIPEFPSTTVVGHSGSLHWGTIGTKRVLVFAGRFHFYEGHPFEKTIIPVTIAHTFGAKLLLVSNAAGSINARFEVGDLMLIDDTMRIGIPVTPFGKSTHARYLPKKMIAMVEHIAQDLKIRVRKGTYMFVTGPTYETKAEVRAFRILGADAVGMSTVPELVEASRLGIDCLGISLLTNMATGVSLATLDHSEIKEVGELRKSDFRTLVAAIIEKHGLV